MHIAVVVPAYNVAAFLGDAISSVINQTHADWSLTVVDDGSDDNAEAVVARFPDPRIRYIRQPNAGVSAARNAGIQACLRSVRGRCEITASMDARPVETVMAGAGPPSTPFPGPALQVVDGEPAPAMTMRGRQLPSNDSFISPRILGRNRAGHENGGPPDGFVFLDGDDWLAPHALSRLADALQAAPWAVAACGRYARVSPNGSVHLAPRPAHGCLLERLLTRNLFANGGHLLIRREAVETAGPFRHDLSYGEDWEYWTRLALLGEFVSIPSPEPPVLILMKRWCQPLSSWRAKARHPRLLAFRANGGTDGGLSPPTTGKVIAASHRIMRTGSPEPILFVRERPGSALFAGGTDPAANRPALEAIYQNPAIAIRIGRIRLGDLSQRARAETAWAVGRELIRHGRQRDGWRWLRRSIQAAPNVRRLALIGLAWLRCGPFRPYRTARVSLFRQYRHCD